MYNKTCFRTNWTKLRKIVKRILGKSVRISLPQQIFNGAFIRRSYVRNAPYDATTEFYEEASTLIVRTAVREAQNIAEGDIISVHVDNLEEKLPPETHSGLMLSICFKLEETPLEPYDECDIDTFVFRKSRA